jgi:hypothetical protein
VLEASGLVATRRIGRVRVCRVKRRRLAMMEGWIVAQSLWKRRLKRLTVILVRMDGDGGG